jgi:ABC-type Zn2+ transport system substrate-binding protein/surface adhesin
MATTGPAMFSIKLKGEKHTYSFRGSEQHALKEASKFLSDVTGYKESFLAEKLRELTVDAQVGIAPADGYQTPHFLVKRVA